MASQSQSQSQAAASTPPLRPDLVSRQAALAIAKAGAARRGGFDEAVAAPGFAAMPLRERAFARALAATMLRRLGQIDAALDARLTKPPPEAARWLLRLGAAQLLFMGTADHAAVSQTVELATADPHARPFKGLVNAVLRGLAREAPAAHDPARLAPDWLMARWRATYGEATALAISGAIAEEPPTDLTPRDDADLAALAALLEGQVAGGSVRVSRHGEIAAWPGFAEGRWWVQDAAAALPVRLLAPRPGERVLDLCAAPGGKTLQLSASGAQVTAVDRSAVRLVRVTENLARTGLSAETAVADAGTYVADAPFDAVLLDAPCSATGTFRRHPDVLWASRAGDVAKLAQVQARLLDAAVRHVRPGGRLVYCVCSLESEEGEAQAQAFAARQPGFQVDAVVSGEAGLTAAAITREGFVRLCPGRAGQGAEGDGFFVARFRRNPKAG